MHIADTGRTYLLTSFAAALLVTATPWTTGADAQSLPPGWSVADIGRPPSPGSAAFVSPTLTVISKGFDVNSPSDQFTFAHTSIRGDLTIIARLKTVATGDPWAQAGLMIRERSGTRSRHVFVFGTPGNRVAVRHRQIARGPTTQASGGSVAAPVWLKLERRGSRFTASRSVNGTSWTTVRSVTVSMSSTALVGFAVASRSKTSSLTATLDNVSVNGTSWTGVNLPPTVSLTSPASGSSYGSPATVALAATAADADGTIAKVEFYSGTTLLSADTTSPYKFSWTVAAAGSYGLKAIATDNKGASTTSATAIITVGTDSPPVVSMASPAQSASFVAGTSITFAATATDDGTVLKVEFYLGTTLVATDTTRPYSTTWPAVVGSHSVSAVATDDKGGRTVSAWRDFIVTAAGVLGTAIFKPASPGDDVDYYVFEVFAPGANPDTAAPLAIQNLGLPPVVAGECFASVRDTIVRLAAGNYIAIVASVGSAGKLRSNVFAFTR